MHIADTNRHRILTFTNDGTLLDQTGSLGQGNGQFYYPWELATDAAGRTYVADTENSRVQILDSNLNFVTAFGESTLYGFYNAVGVASTPDGHIYTADYIFGGGGKGRFSTFDSQGNLTFRREFADVLPPSANWPPPTSLAIGKDGSIYVDFSGQGPHVCGHPVIAKFDAQLNYITAVSGPGCDGGPPSAGMTIDPLGLLYLVEGGIVTIYDGNLNQTNNFAIIGSSGHQVGTTNSIAVDSQGLIYVTTGSARAIYDGPGNQIGFFPSPGSILAAAPDRSLFVADQTNDTLTNYPPASTNAQLVWNLPYFPDGVFVDQSKVYVVGGGGGATVNPVSVYVYSNLFVSGITPSGWRDSSPPRCSSSE
ncbi:MAG TPA: NHL repeat-containing protein [Candidatus Binatia bacterium]|nr:NHL repeat-containing protein [Candidatus Binatia bacterium]